MRIKLDHIRRHPVLTSALALALVLTLFFAIRLVVGAVYWQAHQDEPIRSWMTVGYIGHSWDLDPRMIDQRAGLPMPEGHPLTLSEIAAQRGVPVAEVIATVEAVVQEMRAEQHD
jgi:hypothetical protein